MQLSGNSISLSSLGIIPSETCLSGTREELIGALCIIKLVCGATYGQLACLNRAIYRRRNMNGPVAKRGLDKELKR